MSSGIRRIRVALLTAILIPALTSIVAVNSSQAALNQPAFDLVVHVPNPTLPTNAAITISNPVNETLAISRLETLDGYGWWGIAKVPAGSTSLCFSATGLTKSSTCINPGNAREIWLDASGTPYLSRVAAAKNIKVHLSTTNKTGRFAVLNINGVNQTQTFVRVGTTDFVATFSVPAETTLYTIKTQSTRSKKLYDDVLPIEGDASKLSDIYLTNGLDEIFASAAARSNTVYIHYHRDDNNYKSWGLHTWYSSQFGGPTIDTTWSRPKTPVSSKPDSWGITWKVPIATFSMKLPYIIHKGELKDPISGDQYLDFETYGYEIWIESGKVDVDGNFQIAYPQLPGNLTEIEELSLGEASALASDSPRSSFANDSIYFVMTDRYKNGSTANDGGGFSTDYRNASGFAASDWAWSHGGDLAGLSDGCSKSDGSGEGLPRIKKLGFSSVWITPPFKQQFIQGQSAAYHGYWINDFTQIDPHWGTNAEFKAFVDCAHRLNMKVVLDIVVNHTGDVISYRDGSYGFHNSPNTTAYIPTWGANIKAPAWLNDLANYHNQGNVGDWSIINQYQNGDFFGLDDIKTENTAVINGFADVYSTWVNDFGVDGFRIDTAKHVDNKFFAKWWPQMLEMTASSMTTKSQKLFAFGEYYDSNSANLGSYVRKYGLPSALDFGFQPKALSFAAGGVAANLGEVFTQDNGFITKGKSPYDLVTFLGNHDMGRAARLLDQSGTVRAQSVLLAHDIMFLTRGIPSVYYGDEVGMVGSGGDKAARQDMFPTQVSQWKTEDRVFGSAIGTGSSLTVSTPLTTRLTLLNNLRKQHPALSSGSQTQRLVDAQTMVVSRFDPISRTEYLVGFNSGTAAKSVKVVASTPLSSWQSLMSSSAPSSNAAGEITFTIPARGTIILKALSPLPISSETVSVPLSAMLNTGDQSITLNSAISGSDLGTVTFVAKKDGGIWQVLGSDDSRNFGMIWDYQPFVGEGLAYGSKVSVAAIYKSTSGAISVSSIKQITIK